MMLNYSTVGVLFSFDFTTPDSNIKERLAKYINPIYSECCMYDPGHALLCHHQVAVCRVTNRGLCTCTLWCFLMFLTQLSFWMQQSELFKLVFSSEIFFFFKFCVKTHKVLIRQLNKSSIFILTYCIYT